MYIRMGSLVLGPINNCEDHTQEVCHICVNLNCKQHAVGQQNDLSTCNSYLMT